MEGVNSSSFLDTYGYVLKYYREGKPVFIDSRDRNVKGRVRSLVRWARVSVKRPIVFWVLKDDGDSEGVWRVETTVRTTDARVFALFLNIFFGIPLSELLEWFDAR